MLGRVLPVLLVTSAIGFGALPAHAGPRYTAGWIPALEDAPACVATLSDFFQRQTHWAGCRPRGGVDLHGGQLRLTADLRSCFIEAATEFQLLVEIIALPPENRFCGCATVGCCQSPPQAITFTAHVTAHDSTVRFDHSLPIPASAQIEIRRIELREAGVCFETDATDLTTGTLTHVTAGRALIAAGASVPR